MHFFKRFTATLLLIIICCICDYGFVWFNKKIFLFSNVLSNSLHKDWITFFDDQVHIVGVSKVFRVADRQTEPVFAFL